MGRGDKGWEDLRNFLKEVYTSGVVKQASVFVVGKAKSYENSLSSRVYD